MEIKLFMLFVLIAGILVTFKADTIARDLPDTYKYLYEKGPFTPLSSQPKELSGKNLRFLRFSIRACGILIMASVIIYFIFY